MKKIQTYIRLANMLDAAGLVKEADEVDALIKKDFTVKDISDAVSGANMNETKKKLQKVMDSAEQHMEQLATPGKGTLTEKLNVKTKEKLQKVLDFSERLMQQLIKKDKIYNNPPPGSLSEALKNKGAADERIPKAVEMGLQAFWHAVAEVFTEVKTGDVSPEQDSNLRNVLTTAVEQWLKTNV